MKRELEDIVTQWMSTQSILLHVPPEKEKVHQIHEMVVSNAVELMFRVAAM